MQPILTASLKIQSNVPLCSYSYIGIGGVARFLAHVKSKQQALAAMEFAASRSMPFRIIGRGSNLFFDDKGYGGLIIIQKMESHQLVGDILEAEGGVSCWALARFTCALGLKGLLTLEGIPGSVGGALVMNAGTNKGSVSDHLIDLEWLYPDGKSALFPKEKIAFGYRESELSSFKGMLLSARFLMQKASAAQIEEQKADFQKRKESQPYGAKTLGSTFKNPAGTFAGRLIEQADLKGYRCGALQVSPLHANFMINLGGATSLELESLIALIRERVYQKSGHLLELEIHKIPYEA